MTQGASFLERASSQQFERWKDEVLGADGGPGIPTPRVVDFEVIGSCPYRCEWCWGPDHVVGARSSMSLKELQRSMELIACGNMNEQRFVISGGEPTTRSDIAGVVAASLLIADETVLSTTGDSLYRNLKGNDLWHVLEAAAETATLALPLHSVDMATSQKVMPSLRVNAPVDRVDIVAGVLGRASSIGNATTLRTTVTSEQSLQDICAIPAALLDRGVDLSLVRWKIYEYNPHVGPRANAETTQMYTVDEDDFTVIASEAHLAWGGVFKAINTHPVAYSVENYVIVGPDGHIRIVDAGGDGLSRETYLRDFEHGGLASISHDPIGALDAVTEHMPLSLWDPELVDDEDMPPLVRH